MIAAVVYEMAGGIIQGKDPVSILIMAGAFAATCFLSVNVVFVILVCGLIGVIRTLYARKEREE